MGDIIDGKAISKRIRAGLKERAARMRDAGVIPRLDVLLVGEHGPSHTYVGYKKKAAARADIDVRTHLLSPNIGESDLLAVVNELNIDPKVHGILCQLPLPPHINTNNILFHIDPRKDVDGFHFINAGHLATDQSGFKACTPKGIMRMLSECDVPLRGKHAVVIGRSRVVGRPMGAMLLANDATVTICHRHTADTGSHCRIADVIVSATGIAGLVTRDWVKPGAVVIDVGTARLPDGTLGADVRFDEVIEVASLVSPVPGGVGPMTIAMLLENTWEAMARAEGLDGVV